MAQPLKLTDATRDRIVQAILAGNYMETAAAYAGISKQTLYRWIQMADEPDADPIYRDFRDAVETARAQSEIRNVALIQKAANDGTWQAAAWYLERTNPRRWGRRDSVAITGEDGGPVRVEVSARETLAAKLAAAEIAAREAIETTATEDDVTAPKALRRAR